MKLFLEYLKLKFLPNNDIFIGLVSHPPKTKISGINITYVNFDDGQKFELEKSHILLDRGKKSYLKTMC